MFLHCKRNSRSGCGTHVHIFRRRFLCAVGTWSEHFFYYTTTSTSISSFIIPCTRFPLVSQQQISIFNGSIIIYQSIYIFSINYFSFLLHDARLFYPIFFRLISEFYCATFFISKIYVYKKLLHTCVITIQLNFNEMVREYKIECK